MTRSLLLATVALAGCPTPATPAAADAAVPPVHVTITATVGSTHSLTAEHMLAAGEMQISGEPLAEAMGRDLGNYSRDHRPADLYFDTSPAAVGPWIDLPGFSTGVESYEYSKQAMNGLAFEWGAGTSLVYGPLVDPDGAGGAVAVGRLAARIEHYATASHALGRFVFPAGTYPVGNPSGNTNPTGAGQGAANPLGWPGIWPTSHVFASFDPALDPTGDVALGCAVTSDDDPGASGALSCADYECDATTLHLRNRVLQSETTLTPGADGFSAWKYGLWTINYLQVMHDATETAVASVAAGDLASVGIPGNTVVGVDDSGAETQPGTFIGSSDIEGFQAALFIDEVEERADDWLSHLTTADGVTLSGFASLGEALAYDHSAPLRWFPARIAVSESDDASGFSHPAYALASPDSHLFDLIGLALGYAEFYALTDTANDAVGGSLPARVYFDGDPFAADDPLVDAEATLHDRALAMLRVTLVDLDRLHTDPTSGLLVDDVTLVGATPTRGTTVSTTSVAYAILALRTAARALSSQLELYSNNKPDTAIAETPLDRLPLSFPGDATLTLSGRMKQLIHAEGELLLDHLTDASGRAFAGWDVATGAATSTDDTLDAHTAAIRGLFAAYLATGETRYRDRAVAVFERLQAVFYDADARLYVATPAPVDAVEYTPLRFALLQSALRDIYELVAARPGGEALVPVLEERLGRLNKLVLNGWDDRNQDRLVGWPDECVNVQDGLPRGGLQMAERTLTGETGSLLDVVSPDMPRTATSDREQDCVPEIDDAHLPSALAGSLTFHIARQP